MKIYFKNQCKNKINIIVMFLILLVGILPLAMGKLPTCGETNMWLTGPYIAGRISRAGVAATYVFVALIQFGTLLTSGLLFHKIFESCEGAFFATLFYYLPYLFSSYFPLT